MEIEPVGITFTGTRTSLFPSRMMEPLPYCFSICEIAKSRFFDFSSFTVPPQEDYLFGLSWRPRRSEFNTECPFPARPFRGPYYHQANKKQKVFLVRLLDDFRLNIRQ